MTWLLFPSDLALPAAVGLLLEILCVATEGEEIGMYAPQGSPIPPSFCRRRDSERSPLGRLLVRRGRRERSPEGADGFFTVHRAVSGHLAAGSTNLELGEAASAVKVKTHARSLGSSAPFTVF